MGKSPKTFGEVGQEFIYWCQFGRPSSLAKTTLTTYKRTLELVGKHFGSVPIEDINLEHIANLKKDFIDRGAKIGYMVKVLMLTRLILKFAAEESDLNVMSWQKIKLPPRPRPEVRYLSQGEVDRVLAQIPTDTLHGIRLKAILTTMLDTGMRISEVMSLNRDSIDWDDKSAFIIGKGSKKRKVLFQDWSLWWIKQYLNHRKDQHEAMFVSHQNGYPIARLQTNDVQRAFRRIAGKTGIEKFTPHMARKTAGSTMWNNGADIQDVQVFLGHERLQTTQIYVGKNYDRVREVQHQTLQYRAAADVGITAVIKWSKFHDKCLNCGKTDKPHGARGYCINCYMNLKNARIRAEQAQTSAKPA
jgi:site-specific recombinase XerD